MKPVIHNERVCKANQDIHAAAFATVLQLEDDLKFFQEKGDQMVSLADVCTFLRARLFNDQSEYCSPTMVFGNKPQIGG